MTPTHAANQQRTAAFDPTNTAEWEQRLQALPLRALVTFTVRCAKRVEPLFLLGRLRAEAFAAGIDISRVRWFESGKEIEAVPAAAVDPDGAVYAASHAASRVVNAVADAALPEGADTALHTAADYMASDLAKLLELNLGKPGEAGQPIRWNDPRLGPLWPDGDPDWYTEAKRACFELEEAVRCWRDPSAPPDDPAFVAMMERYLKAQQLYNDGKLNEYRGEYVIFCDDAIIGHSRNLYQVTRDAEEFAAKQGLTPDHLSHYFVPGE